MATKAEKTDKRSSAKRYKVQYPISAYTFLHEARIPKVHFDSKYMHVELTNRRMLAIPLRWIPTLHSARPEGREKYEINPSRTMIVWDPAKCAINDEVRIADYLGPGNDA